MNRYLISFYLSLSFSFPLSISIKAILYVTQLRRTLYFNVRSLACMSKTSSILTKVCSFFFVSNSILAS